MQKNKNPTTLLLPETKFNTIHSEKKTSGRDSNLNPEGAKGATLPLGQEGGCQVSGS